MTSWVAIIATFACAWATLALALRAGWAARLALDAPNARSLHLRPTPRAGGLLTLPWALAAGSLLAGEYRVPIVLAAALCAFSFIDDRAGLPAGLRLLVHLGLSATAMYLTDASGWPLVIALTLALTWMVNLFNFMDGADGLAGGMAAIGFAACGAAAAAAGDGDLARLSFCVTAAASAFLAFNFPPARIFMGDAGSTTLGFLAGALGILGWQRGVWPAWFSVLVFLPFIADATATLIRRALRGERLWQAHREHCYQKLVRMGWPHRRLAIAAYILMAACAGGALALRNAPVPVQVAGLSAAVLIHAAIMIATGVKWRASQGRPGQ
ncbi:MAG: glycosyltransferase family 4 protein [Azospira sp.]|jgi:UDP-N-acetylmuramyl pentapeptide phosphotransferase/UDP-N-acetylglucosamine-1-phosphate transferase|nr:glycosyltransferase family 4 protein [Azospira sp.]